MEILKLMETEINYNSMISKRQLLIYTEFVVFLVYRNTAKVLLLKID